MFYLWICFESHFPKMCDKHCLSLHDQNKQLTRLNIYSQSLLYCSCQYAILIKLFLICVCQVLSVQRKVIGAHTHHRRVFLTTHWRILLELCIKNNTQEGHSLFIELIASCRGTPGLITYY